MTPCSRAEGVTAAARRVLARQDRLRFTTPDASSYILTSGASSTFDIGATNTSTARAWSSMLLMTTTDPRSIQVPCQDVPVGTSLSTWSCGVGTRMIFSGPPEAWGDYKICRRDEQGEWCKTFAQVFWR